MLQCFWTADLVTYLCLYYRPCLCNYKVKVNPLIKILENSKSAIHQLHCGHYCFCDIFACVKLSKRHLEANISLKFTQILLIV